MSFKITKPGYNALTDTNPQHFQFDSDYNTFKFLEILPSFSISVGNAGGTTSQTVTNSIQIPSQFQFVPFFLVYIVTDNNTSSGRYNYYGTNSSTAFVYQSGSSIIGVYEYEGGGTTSVTTTFYPYIFANPI
jgi:hypothetical protein